MYIVVGYYYCKNDYLKLYVISAESVKNEKFCGRKPSELLLKGYEATPDIINKKIKPVFNSRGRVTSIEVL